MKKHSRLTASIIEIILGIILMILYYTGTIDEYWNGMGTALLVVGILQLIRQIRYKTNSSYRESVDLERNDERNRYLSMKAWSWSGYSFVLISAAASIVLKIAGYEEYVYFTSSSVCLIIFLYWIFFLLLRRKY